MGFSDFPGFAGCSLAVTVYEEPVFFSRLLRL